MIYKSDTPFNKFMLIGIISIAVLIGGLCLFDSDNSDAEPTYNIFADYGDTITTIPWSDMDISSEVISDILNGTNIYSADDFHRLLRIRGTNYTLVSTLPIESIDTSGLKVSCPLISAMIPNQGLIITSNSSGNTVAEAQFIVTGTFGGGVGTESAPFAHITNLGWTIEDILHGYTDIWAYYSSIGLGKILIAGDSPITLVSAPAELGLVAQGNSLVSYGGLDKDSPITFIYKGNQYTVTLHCANAPNAILVTEGTCGDNLHYMLKSEDSEQKLYLITYGSGTSTYDWSESNPAPWMDFILLPQYTNYQLEIYLDYAPNLVHIGDYAFYKCIYCYVLAPPNITYFGDYSFADSKMHGWTGKSIFFDEIEHDVYIGAHAFENLPQCSTFGDIFSNATYIGDCAFKNSRLYDSLASSTDYEFLKLEYLGESAFENYSPTTSYFPITGEYRRSVSFIFHEGCTFTEINPNSFKGFAKLGSVSFENNITVIGDYAFTGDLLLASIPLSDTLTHIGDYAFDGCSSLSITEFPRTLEEIGKGAFRNCTSLTANSTRDLIFYNVKIIGAEAFSGCTNASISTSLYNVEVLGSYAFRGVGLTSVSLNQNVSAQPSDDSTFGNPFDSSLRTISLHGVNNPEPYTSSGPHSTQYTPWYFNKDTLTAINIMPSVNVLQSGIFAGMGESKLDSIVKPYSIPNLYTYYILNTSYNVSTVGKLNQSGVTLYHTGKWTVTSDCGTNLTYDLTIDIINKKWTLKIGGTGTTMTNWTSQRSVPWMEYLEYNSLPHRPTRVDMSSATNLKNIGDYAFYSFGQEFTLSPNLEKIGKYSFAYTSIRNTLVLPDSLITIDDFAFTNSTTYFIFPNSVKYIGKSAFEKASTNLAEYESDYQQYGVGKLPTSLEEIGFRAFRDNDSLVLDIGVNDVPNLRIIGAEAFYGCKYNFLSHLHPQALVNTTVIGSYAFNGWDISEIYLNQNVESQISNIYNIEGSRWGNPFNSSLRIIHIVGVDEPIPYTADGTRGYKYTPWYFNNSNLESIIYEPSLKKLQANIFLNNQNMTWLLPRDTRYISEEGATLTISDLIMGREAYITGNLLKTGFCGPNITYQIWDDGKLVLEKIADGQPAIMYSYDNTTNLAPWMEYNDRLNEVVISSSVNQIGAYAFYGMYFNTLTLHTDLEYIGAYAFANCPNLVITTLAPYHSNIYPISSIGEGAFQNSPLVSIGRDLISNIKPQFIINDYTFDNSGTSLTGISAQIHTIGKYAFRNTSSDISTLYVTVKLVDEGAFEGCDKITSLSVPITTEFVKGGGLNYLTHVELAQYNEKLTASDVAYMAPSDIPWIINADILENIATDGHTFTRDGILILPQNMLYHIPHYKITDARNVIGWSKGPIKIEMADTYNGELGYIVILSNATAELDYGNDRTSMNKFSGTMELNNDRTEDLVGEFIIYPHDYVPPQNIRSMVNIMDIIPVMIAISIVLTVVGWLGVKSGRNRGGYEEYSDDSPSSRDPYMGN